MFSFIKKRFLYRFIIILFNDLVAYVHIFDVKNNKTIATNSEEFEISSKDELSEDLILYINKKQEQVERSYVVTLVNSAGQGIVPTCATSAFLEYSIDKRYIYNVCVDKKFSNYVSKIDIKWLQKLFLKTGIDLIFSPFTILYRISKTIEIEENVVLYMMQVNQTVTLLIKQKDQVVYGSFIDLSVEKNLLYSDYENEEEEIEIEEEFDIEDDFDTKDWDNNIEKFDESLDDSLKSIESKSSFGKFLSNSLQEFYKDKRYKGDFVDKVFFFSEEKIDKNVLEFMENELFLSVDLKTIDLNEEILKVCQDEVINV